MGLFFIGLIEFLCIIAFFIGVILFIWALLKKRRKLTSILFIVCSFAILIKMVIVSELFYHDEMEQQRIEREKEEKEEKEEEEKIIQQEEKTDVSQNQSSHGKSAKENQTDKDDEEVEMKENELKEENQTPDEKFVSDSSEYISEDIARKLYGIIVNDIGFSEVEFKGKNEMANSVWDISCDGISILAVASDDVYRIWNSDCTFYEEGTVVTTKQQMESTIISSDERSKYYFMAQEIVTQCLKNPSSADFPSITFSPQDISMEKKDDIVAVQSYVDATNSFGGQVRSQWTVEFRVTDLDNMFYEVLYVNIDGQASGTYVELN